MNVRQELGFDTISILDGEYTIYKGKIGNARKNPLQAVIDSECVPLDPLEIIKFYGDCEEGLRGVIFDGLPLLSRYGVEYRGNDVNVVSLVEAYKNRDFPKSNGVVYTEHPPLIDSTGQPINTVVGMKHFSLDELAKSKDARDFMYSISSEDVEYRSLSNTLESIGIDTLKIGGVNASRKRKHPENSLGAFMVGISARKPNRTGLVSILHDLLDTSTKCTIIGKRQ